MATRHELIHIDFVANAGKANPVLQSLKESCESARIEKEKLDKALSEAKTANAPKEVIAGLESQLQQQAKTWQALQKGVREYAKGIDTLSKGIKEYNEGTLDEMSAKFNKSLYNAAKLAQSSVKTGSDEWNQLQRIMDAADRNVTRAREDINLLFQSLKDGSSVSTVQLTRARDVLEDLARLAVVNSEEWRGLKAQMNEVSQAVTNVQETERRLKGEITTEQDAMRLSNTLTKESIALRHADGEAAMNAAKKEREGIESTMRGIQESITLRGKKRAELKGEIDYQRNLNNLIEERDREIANGKAKMDDAEQRRKNAQQTINDFELQKVKVRGLKNEVDDLEKTRKKEEKTAEKSAKSANEHSQAVESQTQTVRKLEGEVGGLNTKLEELNRKIKETGAATEASAEATKKKVTLTKKEQAEMATLTKENETLTGTIELLKKQRDELAASQEKGAKATDKDTAAAKKNTEAVKEEAQAIKMSAEEAQAALDKMQKEKATIKFKTDGSFEVSDMEEVQKSLFSIFKTAGGDSAVKNDGVFLLDNAKKIRRAVELFQERYGIGDFKDAKDVMKKIATGNNGGLIKQGIYTADPGADIYSLQIKRDEGKWKERLDLIKELFNISKGVTTATKEQTAADKEQEEQVKKLREEYLKEKDALQKRKEEYQKRLRDAESMLGPTEKNGELTAKGKALEKAETYRKSYVEKQEEKEKEAFARYQAAKNGTLNENTQATEANTKAKQDNLETEKQRKQIDGQINALEEQKLKNTERLTQLQEKSAQAEKQRADATKQKAAADKEAADKEKTMADLLQKRGEIEANIADKKKLLEEAQKKLNELQQQNIAGDKAEASSTKELLEAKKAEYEAEKEKLGPMKEAKDQAIKDRRKADRDFDRAVDDINRAGDKKYEKDRKSEAEVLQMEQRVKELTRDIEEQTKAYDDNARAIAEWNKKETDAAIEMAQSENVSIEKVKQAIELLQKKIMTEETDTETMQARGEAINRLKDRLTEMNAEVAKLSQPIADRLSGDLDKMSETEIKQAIDAGNQLIKTYESGSDKAKAMAENIARAEKHLKEHGLEAARQAQQQKDAIEMMENQLSKGSALTESALKAQVKYWQQLADDPKAAAEAVKQYTANMKEAQSWLDAKERVDIRTKAGRLQNMDSYSVSELKEGIEAAKVMQQTFRLSDDEVKKLSEDIVAAETRINKVSIEAERAAQRQRESIALMQNQLNQGSALTENALKAQVQYWQRLADDPKNAAESTAEYIANMKQAQSLLDEKRNIDIREKAGRLSDMESYSISELQEGIEAAKVMQKTFKLTDEEVRQLSEDIVVAEERISKVSIETERALRKENEELREMERIFEAAQNGEFETANMQTLEDVIKKLKAYQALINDPNGLGKETFDATKVQIDALTTQLNNLKGVTEKTKGIFQNADEVMARFGEHMAHMNTDTVTQQTEKLAQTLDEKLNAATSEWDENIRIEAERLDYWEQQIKETTEELAKLEAELDALENKKKNRSVFGKIKDWIVDEDIDEDIDWHKELIKNRKWDLNEEKQRKAETQSTIDYWKQQKAEALGLNEAEEQVAQTEEKLQQARRMTNEELQQGIKLLEQEAAAQDRSTADGEKRYQELQQTIGEMNKELKEATGEWMKLVDAEKLAGQAGKDGFSATPEQIQKATQAIERQRDALIKSIKAKRDNKEATEEEKVALAKEEKELTDLTNKLRSLKFEQDNVNMSQEKMRALIEKPANAVNLDELRAAIKRADGQLRQMEGSLGANSKEYKTFAAQVKQAKVTLKEMEGQSKATTGAFDQAISRLKSYVGVYLSFNIALQKVIATFGDLMTLSDKMGEVRKTTGFTADEVGRLSDNLTKLDTRTPLQDLMSISAKAGQLGLKTTEDIEGFTRAANMMMVALPEMGEEAATQMMKVAIATGEVKKIQEQMNQGLIDGSSATEVAMTKIASTIDQLRANSAAAAPAITDFVKRVGAVGAQSGISIDQIAALGATVDALGMRVEMSATALSRMIPAIKNNAFDLAKILKVEPNTIRNLFETGRGMEVILMIFQHIKEAGMDADSIEKMLNMGGMQDVMKELNQQGARAGIVFGGLSQNVEELQKNLDIASLAYEENVAILKEYNKMNDTTAAKWERLKNEVEEFFVTAGNSKLLGGVIDVLRGLVNFLTGNVGPALRVVSTLLKMFITYWTILKIGLGEAIFVKAVEGFKAMWTGLKALITSTTEYLVLKRRLKNAEIAYAAAATATEKAIAAQSVATIKAKMAQESLNKSMKANIWMAVASAILYAVYALATWEGEVDAADRAIDEMNNKIDAEKEALDELFDRYANAAGNLKARRVIMEEINSKYGAYLGYLLTDANNSELVALAHERIASALEEEIIQREKMAGISNIKQEFQEDLMNDWSKFTDKLREAGLTAEDIAKTRDDIMTFLKGLYYDDIQGRTIFKKGTFENIDEYLKILGIENPNTKSMDTEQVIALYVYKYLQENFKLTDAKLSGITGVSVDGRKNRIQTGFFGSDFMENYATTYNKMLIKMGKYENMIRGQLQNNAKTHTENTKKHLDELKKSANEAVKVITKVNSSEKDIAAAYNNLAGAVMGLQNLAGELGKSTVAADRFFGKGITGFVNKILATPGVDQKKTKGIITKLREKLQEKTNKDNNTTTTTTTGGGGGRGGSGDIWGNKVDAASTEYGTWNVEELVARRKQMDKFQDYLKPGVDVRKVLAEDTALMKAINDGKIGADWKSALDWYNAERKKITNTLKDERYATNQGHWIDEKTKKGRRRRNIFDESDYAVAELDRYYSRRKEALEKARQEENMSEELYNREVEKLEQEHLQKRSDLRFSFTKRLSKDQQKAFRDWWAALEKQNELDHVNWETSDKEWAKARQDHLSKNNLKAQEDLTKLQSITVKHLNQIAKIIDKERPYDGITANLRKNLTEMDILFADMDKANADALAKGGTRKYNEADYVKAGSERLKFLLGEAETAYNSTVEEVLGRMGEAGMTAWAEEIRNSPDIRNALMAQLQKAYDEIQDAIKKESNLIKKHADIWWSDIEKGQTQSRKGVFEKMLSDLELVEDSVKRANSLINAGQASERVADKLAIKRLQVQLQMQQTYYDRMRQIGEERIRQLEAQGKLEDAEHLRRSLNLSLTKEQSELDKKRVEIANQLEESQNRLYKELREWGELLASSVKSLFEAEHAGDAEYYNELAKMRLTGKGGPGAGTYIVIENEGTSDATAHYEYLNEEQALERQREIERQNAQAEAWKKVMDDINMKMNDLITDQINAMLQNASIDANTDALNLNTQALNNFTEAITQPGGVPELLKRPEPYKGVVEPGYAVSEWNGKQYDSWGREITGLNGDDADADKLNRWLMTEEEMQQAREQDASLWQSYAEQGIAAHQQIAEAQQEIGGPYPAFTMTDEQLEVGIEKENIAAQAKIDASNMATQQIQKNQQELKKGETETDKSMTQSGQSMYAKLIQSANLYGIAYQAMSNDNLSTSQKFQMIALQTAGQTAISMLTADFTKSAGEMEGSLPAILAKCLKIDPIWGAVIFAGLTGLLGGLMGIATSKVAKSKSQISQATGASVGAGRLSTGMLTYAEGNVNEFTDPESLTPGRHYDVDGADGRTYRAKYMGRNAKTHITNGPEFHLVGEKGREAIIDAHTTRNIQMNDPEIWRTIQTLYNGGSAARMRSLRRGRGVRTFADGNMDEFEEMIDGGTIESGMGFDPLALQGSLDRNSAVQEALLERLNEPIYAQNILYGPDGLPNVLRKLTKEASRHGEKYL